MGMWFYPLKCLTIHNEIIYINNFCLLSSLYFTAGHQFGYLSLVMLGQVPYTLSVMFKKAPIIGNEDILGALSLVLSP